LAERGADGEQRRSDEEDRRCHHAERGEQCQCGRYEELQDLHDHQESPAIERISEQATEEQQRHLWDRACEAEEADLERRVRQLVNLPGHSDRRELAAERGERLPRPERTVVAVLQCWWQPDHHALNPFIGGAPPTSICRTAPGGRGPF